MVEILLGGIYNCWLIRDSSMVERTPVKRLVVGSSPTRGASILIKESNLPITSTNIQRLIPFLNSVY